FVFMSSRASYELVRK
ncbi:hypothetical protein MKD33_07715, partial [Chromobacterium piscinae]